MPRFTHRLFTVSELYAILVEGLRSLPRLVSARIAGRVSARMAERIMLAVTEVNGCAICSYVHARLALESGMAGDEIRMLLAGDTGSVPAEESLAIAFAQHYADARGAPTREAWERLVDAYGRPTALGILGAARAMMIGNAYGLAWGALASRSRGRPDARSSLGAEAAMLIAAFALVPVSLAHALVAGALRAPIIRFPRT
jgi:AhpD family alkylhydroperoxidase